MKKSKVGRPKLADKELKKKTYIMLGISALLIMILLSGTLVSLNVLNPKKLKGEVTYPTYGVGDLFCLGTECFYTISDNGDTVTGLARYNLLVGYEVYDEYDENNIARTEQIPTSIEGYGLQNEIAKGYDYVNESNKSIGGVDFTENWSNTYWTDNNGNLLSKYGDDYPAFVYDQNSLVHYYVDNYESYLKKNGYSSVKATLINYGQIQQFGCGIGHYECYDAPDWFYSTTYWTGISTWSENVKAIMNDKTYDSCTELEGGCANGVRPVITVAKSDLVKKEETTTTTVANTTTKKEETTTVANTTTKKEEVATTKKKVVRKTANTTTTENKIEESTTTTKVNNINKIVSTTKSEVKEEKKMPVVPIAIGGGTAVVAGIGYIVYILKFK